MLPDGHSAIGFGWWGSASFPNIASKMGIGIIQESNGFYGVEGVYISEALSSNETLWHSGTTWLQARDGSSKIVYGHAIVF